MAVWNPRANELFLRAAEIEDHDQRRELLDCQCGGDDSLRRQVEALLAAKEQAGDFLEQPAVASPTQSSELGEPPSPQPLATLPPASMAERAGAVIADRYRLIEPIGEGGMGSVWLALQSQPVKRKVALKFIKPGMDSRQVLARFEAERQALALMDHPNIAKVLDGGLAPDGRPFFVMELVKGVPITEYCDARKLTPKQRLELFVPVCQAIQHAHQKGIIHRDIKPSNVLVAPYDDRPVPKVIDFGMAKATGQQLSEHTIHTGLGAVVGTPQYMSPEQATLNNLDVDTRSDVYSLGVLLYELLTGSPPFSAQALKQAGIMEMLRVVREEEPPRPSTKLSTAEALPSLSANRGTDPSKLAGLLRNELDWIVMKSLEKDRARRYETANGLAADVQRFLGGEPVLAHPPSAGYRLRMFLRKHRGPSITAGVAALAMVLATATATLGLVEANRARIAESLRAEAEHVARIEAQQAVAAERQAKQAEAAANAQAQARLEQIEKGNDVITSIFADLDIRAIKESGRPLEAVLAERLVRAAEQVEGQSLGDPLAVARLQNRLGETLLSLGHPRDAIVLLAKARETLANELGANDPETLMSMNNLACGHQDAGQLDLALPLFEKALELRQDTLGADHPHSLDSMNNLATGYLAAGKRDQALQLFEETFERMKAELSADHPHVIVSMNNLAAGYKAVGQIHRTLPLLEETLRLGMETLGANHHHTLLTMNNLAVSYQEAGQLDRALPLYEKTLDLQKINLGAEHPLTIVSMGNLAKCYLDAGQLERALPLLVEALALSRAKLGADHPDTLQTMNYLARGHRDAGQPERALPLLLEAAEGIERQPFQNEYAAQIAGNLANCHEQLGQFEKAEAWRRKLLVALKKQAGVDSPDYVGQLQALGLNLLEQEKWTGAEPVLRECLALREKGSPDDWTTFHARSLLGGALLGQKRFADAEPLLLAGYRGIKQRQALIPPQESFRLGEAVARLVELYRATDKPEEGEIWRKELQALQTLQEP